MVEHLEDSQGFDFMGHLAGKQPKRGQFFVLPEQFLDSTMRSSSRAFSIASAESSASAVAMCISSFEKTYVSPLYTFSVPMAFAELQRNAEYGDETSSRAMSCC